ncbi:MAG: MEKHLA domain-containing protein [Azonexus sp.]|nr:MEKHLA domain-containing protein [Azonexus sp.]
MSDWQPILGPASPPFTLLIESFRRLTGRDLLPAAAPTEAALWSAPRVIVAHGTEADPIFFYGNRLALQLFEMSWETFTRLPSRFSAEAPDREQRARLLARVARDGYIDDYAGVRIAASGRRFRIESAVVWNLIDAAGICHGQAATFEHWVMLDEPT